MTNFINALVVSTCVLWAGYPSESLAQSCDSGTFEGAFAGQRDKTFNVGTREFDPADMGFKNGGASTLDTSLPGNSNAGHDGPLYGNAELARDKVRMDALLEYLKTL